MEMEQTQFFSVFLLWSSRQEDKKTSFFKMVCRPFDVCCLLRSVCVCMCVGAVWRRDESRYRCCDRRPSSALRYGGQVYLNNTPTRPSRLCFATWLCSTKLNVCYGAHCSVKLYLYSALLQLSTQSACVQVCLR